MDEDDFIRLIVSFALAIAIGGIIFAVLYDSPDFKITKEVCRGETMSITEMCGYNMSDLNLGFVVINYTYSSGHPSEITSKIIEYKNRTYKPKNCNKQENKICKDIEFDEINTEKDCLKWDDELAKLSNEINKTITSSDSYRQHLENMDNVILSSKIYQKGINCLHYNRYDSLNIPKQELTIDWLNKNSDECLIDNEFWVKSDEFGILTEDDCDKWKVGNYAVEVSQ